MKIVIAGLSITSSWGNGHATTYRSLVRGLASRGHDVLFLERNAEWYAGNRDTPNPDGCATEIYENLDQLFSGFEKKVHDADLVIVGSFVPEGVAVGEWVTSIARGKTSFYDIDTPITLAALERGTCGYITPDLIAKYRVYFSFTGGPALRKIENLYGSPLAKALYCSVDVDQYMPVESECRWDLGYLGTWSADRQPSLEKLLMEPARQWNAGRFAVVGPQYPDGIQWPSNVDREIHLSPREHPGFYASQAFTLNITRDLMKEAGYSPSVRLFEAGACAVPIISDWWEGLDTVFEPGREILIAESADDTLRHLRDVPEFRRREIGTAARRRVLAEHTPLHRAIQIEQAVAA